jgi:hypothetical protein
MLATGLMVHSLQKRHLVDYGINRQALKDLSNRMNQSGL